MFQVRRSSLLALILFSTIGFGACVDEAHSPVEMADEDPSTVVAVSECSLSATDTEIGARIEGLQVEVDALADAGVLNGGQARALTNHLTNASRQLERGQYCAVRAHLGAFRDQLEELAGGGVLGDRDAYELRHASRLALGGPTYQEGDPEEYAPGVTGEIRTVTFEGESLRVEVIDGLAIFNGDMILGFADELEGAAAGGPAQAGVCHTCTRWSGSVGYSFADDWGDESVNAIWHSRVAIAIDHISARTSIEFEQRTTGERVVFRNSMGCSSMVGRQVFTGIEPQYINLAPGCGIGAVIHEILHALGVKHEQARNDRNDFVMVNLDAVRDGRKHNFDQYGSSGQDIGAYDFGSIMHYGCGDFRDPDSTVNPITPIAPGVTCADLGSDTLTAGDISGIYTLYRPVFTIVGATPGQVADRFNLSLHFTTEPVNDAYIQWGADGMGVLATGATFSTAEAGLTDGVFRLFAELWIGGRRISRQDVEVTISNSPPSVSLGPDRQVQLNRPFTVTAATTDAEDGSCTVPTCTYEWSPEPTRDRGGDADYFGWTLGPRTISVTVTDGAGASDSDDLTVLVIDSPPTPVITSPGPGTVFSTGAIVTFTGLATDPNYGPGPDDGQLPCDRLHWTSSDLSDLVSPRDDCAISITFGAAGPRTITLRATDPAGQMTTTSIGVQVDGCGVTGCAPDVVLGFETPPDLDGSQYVSPFSEPGFLIDTPIEMKAWVTDVDGPPTSISLEWEIMPPCFGPCSPLAIGTTGLFAPNTSYLTWTPADDVVEWTNCVLVPLPYLVRVTATDTNGNSRTVSRTFYLACDLI